MPQLFSPAPATPSPKKASPMRVLATKVKMEAVEVGHRIRKLSLHVPKRRRRESQASSSSRSSSMTSSSTSSNSSALAHAIITTSTIISTPIFPFVEIIPTPTQTAPQTPKAVRKSEKMAFPVLGDHGAAEVDLESVRSRKESQQSSSSSTPSFASAHSTTQNGNAEADDVPMIDVVEPIREEAPTAEIPTDMLTRVEDNLSLAPMSTPSSPTIDSPSASQTLEQSSAYVEPPVPDPFLIIDENSSSEGENEPPRVSTGLAVSESRLTVTPSQEISLAPTPPPQQTSLPLPPVNLLKPVPPPPPSSGSDPEEEDAPDVYLPGLVVPTMFLPIPNTDPLTILLTKYIYPPEKRPLRDVTGEWHHSDFHTLVMTNSWRALARMARDRLVTTDPEDLNLVLSLWYLRLACLARLRLFNQTAAECTNLFAVLNAIQPPESKTWVFERLLPFELEVMYARLKYWAGDHMGYLDALYALLKKCKLKARESKSDIALVSMWKERGARICLILASQLIEMKDFAAAAKLLEPLCPVPPTADVRPVDTTSGDEANPQGGSNLVAGTGSPSLRSAVARIYLQTGNLPKAAQHFSIVAADPDVDESSKDMNEAFLASAEGEWDTATAALRRIVERDPENYAAVNNLSVTLLSQGELKEAIQVLEVALASSPSSVVVAEPYLFNLATLYELRSAEAMEKKKNLLMEVAKWSGDGLRTTCLKMPTN